jgi:hypothetical protein
MTCVITGFFGHFISFLFKVVGLIAPLAGIIGRMPWKVADVAADREASKK